MNELIAHEKENWEGGESFVKDNGQKFQRHCVELLRMMYQGKRLHGRQVEVEFNMDGRRLRELYQHRKDILRAWKKDDKGKNIYMEYWLEIPPYPTKSAVIERSKNVINLLKAIPGSKLEQGNIFNGLNSNT